jgi:hypothetical protein
MVAPYIVFSRKFDNETQKWSHEYHASYDDLPAIRNDLGPYYQDRFVVYRYYFDRKVDR